MTKEERELRNYVRGVDDELKLGQKFITALVRACYEDAAETAEEYDKELVLSGRKIPFRFYTKKIAAVIRGKK